MTTTIATTEPTYSLGELVAYMLRLGTLGFGGPVALAGYMRRDLVERRGWITEADLVKKTEDAEAPEDQPV